MPLSPIPHCHPLPSPHATAYLYPLFQSCFCLVYLGLILPFLWQFAKREARVGDLMESEGMGGVSVPGAGHPCPPGLEAWERPGRGGEGVCLALAHPSAVGMAPEDPGCEGAAKRLWPIL